MFSPNAGLEFRVYVQFNSIQFIYQISALKGQQENCT